MEESDDYYDRLIEDTESYWDGLINGLEEYKTRWEELADLEEEAKMNAALKELGITTEDILNMSEEDFEKFKQRYLAILTEIYAGNEDVLTALQEASGISAESLQPLIEELQRTLEKTDEYSESAGNAKTETEGFSIELDKLGDNSDDTGDSIDDTGDSIDELGSSADNAATSVGNLNTELSDTPSTEGYDAIADAMGRIKGVADAVCESVKKATTELNNFAVAKSALSNNVAEGLNKSLDYLKGKGFKEEKATAYADGTPGLDHDEKNAIRSEYSQKELTIYPNGKAELTESPVMSDLPKGTVIYNEEQTEKILDNKAVPVGKAFSKGTDDGVVIMPDGRVARDLRPGDKMYDMQQKFLNYFTSIDGNLEKLVPNSTYERNMQMNEIAEQISNSSIVNNKNVQQPINQVFNITMPNVTDATTATELMNDLQSLSRKKFQVDWDK